MSTSSFARAALLALTACSTAPEPSPSDAPSDALYQLGTLATGTWTLGSVSRAVRFSEGLSASNGPDGTTFTVPLIATFDLASVQASTWSIASLPVSSTGPRTFDLQLDDAAAIEAVMAGEPLLLDLRAVGGGRLSARLQVSAELDQIAGSSFVEPQPELRPVYLRGGDPLTVRGRVRTGFVPTQLRAESSNGADPDLTNLGPRAWSMQWAADDLRDAMAPPTPQLVLTAEATGGSEFVTQGNLRLALTDVRGQRGPMPTNWAAPTCEPTVQGCVDGTTGDDLSACGTFQAVAACVALDVCFDVPGEPVDLDEVPVTGLEDAVVAWDNACLNGGTWCGLDSGVAYDVPQCLEAGLGLLDIVDEVFQADAQTWYSWGFDPAWGQSYDSSDVGNIFLFGTGYNPTGPDLLNTLHDLAGSTNVQAWWAESEIPCPNCHEWVDLVVLWYPDTGRVFVLQGTHGWDS